MAVTPADLRALERRGVALEAFGVTYNAVEGIVAISAGLVAGSVALLGFGLNSGIEVSASVIVLLHLARRTAGGGDMEKRAALFVGVSLIALAVYVASQAAYDLATRSEPEVSYLGIGMAAASLTLMPALARVKHDLAHKIESRALEAESRETLVCSYLSATMLVGLGANAAFGWWWADPAAALIMVAFVVREGWEALTRKELCCG